jgi:hypothetical protein
MEEIFKKQTKGMAFKGKDPVRSKIVIIDNIMEQTDNLSYQLSILLFLHQNEKKYILLFVLITFLDSEIIN